MGTLEIGFIGINTQFYATENLLLPVPARFVFVGGTAGGTVPDHQPSISAEDADGEPVDFSEVPCVERDAEDATRYWLRGVTMRVLAGGPVPVNRPPCLPSLRFIYPPMVLNGPVILSGAPPARAYFDVLGGTMTNFLSGESVATLLRLDAAEENVVLQFQCWDGPITNVTIKTPALVVVKNEAVDSSDDEDFLLSYGIATRTPTREEVPLLTPVLDAAVACAASQTAMLPIFRNYGMSALGPECSNSGYP
jgi:hypothetical protein